MKKVSVAGTKIFEKIVAKLGEDSHKRFEPNCAACMRLSVEKIGNVTTLGKDWQLISFAHYYEQNGDLMADPEVCYMYNAEEHEVFPYYVKMDGIGLESTLYDFVDNSFRPKAQRDMATFSTTWFNNIKDQFDF